MRPKSTVPRKDLSMFSVTQGMGSVDQLQVECDNDDRMFK